MCQDVASDYDVVVHSGDVLALAMAIAVMNLPIRRVLTESLSEPAS